MAKPQRRDKEEKEQEFVDAVQKLLGFPLMPWQKPILLKIRADTMAGRKIDLAAIKKPPSS